jgi:hypothetical protein
MRNFLIFLLLLICKFSYAQLNDNFTDGDFIRNPTWVGNISDFYINSNKQLQTIVSTVDKTVNLATPNTLSLNAKWSFFIKLGFDPSGTNQVRVYLTSDNSDFQGSLNGYYLLIGETGTNDGFSLFRQKGTTSTKIITGPKKIRPLNTEFKANVLVTRDEKGNWEVLSDNTGGTNYVSEGKSSDMTFKTSSYFGVRCKYSKSRSGLFIFDDFKITPLIIDSSAPELINFSVIDTNKIELTFNEPLNITEAITIANYKIMPGNILPSTVVVNGVKVLLNYALGFNTGNYELTISNIKDLNNNALLKPINYKFFYTKPYEAKLNDIVINEIFADPNPKVDLPDAEFIELWNTTKEEIKLKGFKYSNTTTNYIFDKESILPNEYLIVCAKSDTSLFKPYGRVIGISPFPTLNNTTGKLKLTNPTGKIIYSVDYSDNWYRDPVKKQGGYSLELIDPNSNCKASQNYAASNSVTGGTPGKQNSIYLINKTTLPLKANLAFIKNEKTITINFNRGLDSLQASLTNQYLINNGVGNPISAISTGSDFSSVDLKFNETLTKNRIYNLTINGVSDCGGQNILHQEISFLYPGEALKDDVLVNEILFNPKADGSDFVEIYNNSNKSLDFKDLFIATTNSKDSLTSIKQLSSNSLVFEPSTYWVITEDPENIKSLYTTLNSKNFIKLKTLPAFSNDKGRVIILNKNNERIDQLDYNVKMHFALIKDPEGVSLERSSFTKATNEIGNFKSAAASVGYATPTYKNSQFLDPATTTEEISLASETFSPDNDGFEDVLRILYNLDKPNWVANVTVYNDKGKVVKKLVRNQTLASTGELQWDGLDDSGSIKAKTGIYIIYVELFNLDGDTKKFKKTAVLASKFL